jgi:hypothetical protein
MEKPPATRSNNDGMDASRAADAKVAVGFQRLAEVRLSILGQDDENPSAGCSGPATRYPNNRHTVAVSHGDDAAERRKSSLKCWEASLAPAPKKERDSRLIAYVRKSCAIGAMVFATVGRPLPGAITSSIRAQHTAV